MGKVMKFQKSITQLSTEEVRYFLENMADREWGLLENEAAGRVLRTQNQQYPPSKFKI
jgi:hypothetical protein